MIFLLLHRIFSLLRKTTLDLAAGISWGKKFSLCARAMLNRDLVTRLPKHAGVLRFTSHTVCQSPLKMKKTCYYAIRGLNA